MISNITNLDRTQRKMNIYSNKLHFGYDASTYLIEGYRNSNLEKKNAFDLIKVLSEPRRNHAREINYQMS